VGFKLNDLLSSVLVVVDSKFVAPTNKQGAPEAFCLRAPRDCLSRLCSKAFSPGDKFLYVGERQRPFCESVHTIL